MAERNQETKTDFETWLLNFEKQAGRPVVVSLMIENGHVDFMSCVNKKQFSMEWSPDDDSPDFDLKKINKDSIQACIDRQDYIG